MALADGVVPLDAAQKKKIAEKNRITFQLPSRPVSDLREFGLVALASSLNSTYTHTSFSTIHIQERRRTVIEALRSHCQALRERWDEKLFRSRSSSFVFFFSSLPLNGQRTTLLTVRTKNLLLK